MTPGCRTARSPGGDARWPGSASSRRWQGRRRRWCSLRPEAPEGRDPPLPDGTAGEPQGVPALRACGRATVSHAVALVHWERRSRSPLIDVRMLAKNAPLQRTYLRQILTYLATYAVMYGSSQWMEQSKGL